MNYFNEHRRKLIKQNYIRGTKDTVQGVQKLELENTVNLPPCKLEIHGKTEQKEYSGYNLFNVNNFKIDATGCLLFDISSLVIGTKYTVTSNKPLSWFKISTMHGGYNSVQKSDTNNGFTKFTFTMARHPSISEAKIQYLILGIKERVSESLPQGDVTDISQLEGYEIQITEGEDSLSYEPYVGGQISPSPSYAQDIISVGNNGIGVEVRGINLLDMKDTTITATNNTYIDQHTNLSVEPSTTYTLAFDYEFIGEPTIANASQKLRVAGYIREGTTFSRMSGKNFDNYTKGRFIYNFTTKSSLAESYQLFFRIPESDSKFTCKLNISNITLVKGKYSDLPYYQYIEPEAYTALGAELMGIENAIDTLCVDYGRKKAFKNERVLYKSVGELIDAYGAEYDGVGAICINNDQPRMEISERNIPYYCTHFISYHNDPHVDESNPRFEVTASGQIWFYYPPLRSVEEFKAWCYENDVKIAYVLENEHQIDITNTEACQALLNIKLPEGESVIFEVSADLAPSNVSLEYYSKTKEDKHKITVNYEDISGMQIKDSDEHFVRRDSLCKIISPNIDGYEPESESTIVCAKSDMEITLIYNKK